MQWFNYWPLAIALLTAALTLFVRMPWLYRVGAALLFGFLVLGIFALSLRLAPRNETGVSSLVDEHGKPYSAPGVRDKGVAYGFATAFVIILVLIATLSGAGEKLYERFRPKPEISLFMDCGPAFLPIKPEITGGPSHVLLLNEAIIRSQQIWGISDHYEPWPAQGVVDKAAARFDLGIVCLRCALTNHSQENLTYVLLPLSLWFGHAGGEQNRVDYAPVIAGLDGGKSYVVYLVNDCDTILSGIWRDTTQAQVLGESNPREISLHRMFRTPVEQILELPPSKTNWSGSPCK